MQFAASHVFMERVTMHNVHVRQRFIVLSDSDVTLEGMEIHGLVATGVAPLCTSQDNSSLIIRNCRLWNFASREQGMMLLTNSMLKLEDSYISGFNATFVFARDTSVSVNGSSISNGGLLYMDLTSQTKVTAGFLECYDCSIRLHNSVFRGLSGTNGGVLSTVSQTAPSPINVTYCEFDSCYAENDGGALYIQYSDMHIEGVIFDHCHANRGAGVFFDCLAGCSGIITQTDFRNSTASEGAGFRWTRTRPSLSSITSVDNQAAYGPLEASIPTHMVLVSANDSTMRGVAGVRIESPILVAFLDNLNQTVATDNSSHAELVSQNLIGTTYLSAASGIANFSSIIVNAYPDSTIPVGVFSESINSTGGDSFYRFYYYSRLCVPGEISSSKGCYPCPKNTFSVDPSEPDCRACPTYAVCPGKYELILESGYWRSSELSSLVHICPIRNACLGGQESTCAEGYSGKLCSQCDHGYYMAGLTYCIQCENLGVRLTRVFVFLFVFTVFAVVLVRNSVRKHTSDRSMRAVTTLKILLNFLQSVIMISTITVDWKSVMMGLYSANEMFSSVAVTSFTLECYPGNTHVGMMIEPVYFKAIVASLAPIALVVLSYLAFALLSLISRNKVWRQNAFQSSLMLLYMMHPYVVKAGITLVTCKEIEGTTKWLTAEASIQCWTGSHRFYAIVLFIPMFMLFIMGIPMLLLATFLKVRRTALKGVVSFFTAGFTATHMYWELIIMGRKTMLLVCLGLLGSVETRLQVLAGLILLYLFLMWHLQEYPYVSLLHNRLESAGLFILTVLGGFSFYFMAELGINEVILMIISFVILVLVLSFILVCLILLVVIVFCGRKLNTTVAPAVEPERNSSVMAVENSVSIQNNPPNSKNTSMAQLKEDNSSSAIASNFQV